jgi:choline dehydrogenase-like flavoprotein
MTPATQSVFTVRYYTDRYAPNHLVTLRTDVDGWDYDIYGDYRSGPDSRGFWVFQLDAAQYTGTLAGRVLARLVLDRDHPMTEPPLALPLSGEHDIYETEVTFANPPERFLHGHENLHVFESPVQQHRFRANRNEQVTYDVIVVGSGMSGGIVADQLSDLGAKVLLLEAGSLLFPTHMYNLPGDWEPLKDEYFVRHHWPVTGSTFEGGVKINFGGGSLFWSGILQEAGEWEFGDHWPDSVRDYLLRGGGYRRALDLMREQVSRGPYEELLVQQLRSLLPDYRVRKLPRARHQPHLTELPDGSIVQQNLIRESNGMFSTVDLLLDSMSYPGKAGKENLTVNLNHMATHVEVNGSEAKAVVCQDLLANTRRRFHGKFVVLAAGSFGTTRIALTSGLTDPSSLIGKGLSDHPNFSVRFEWPMSDAPIGIDDHAKVMLQHAQAADGHHPYNVELLVNYQYWDRRVADEEVWRQRIVQPMDRIGIDVQFFFPSRLNDDNYVKLDQTANKLLVYTAPNDGGLRYGGEVRAVAAEVLKSVTGGHQPASARGLRYFRGAQIGHAGGTMRMGTAATGVVDDSQRMLAYDNVYVADLSVFPSILAAKPSLTLAALSLRLADTIAARLPRPKGDPAYRGIRRRAAAVQ